MKRREPTDCSVRHLKDGSSEIYDPATGKALFIIEADHPSGMTEWQRANAAIVDAALERSTFQDLEAGLQ